MAQVQIAVRVPKQDFFFYYTEEEWNHAVETGTVADLMDYDLSDLDIQEDIYGPDDKLLVIY